MVIAHEPDGLSRLVEDRLTERGYSITNHIVTHDYQDPNRFEPWPDFDAYDLLIVMGSVRSLTRKDEIGAWIHDELALVRAAHERGQPILGICFGGQILAEALGGSVSVAPVTEIGWYDIQAAPGAENPAGPGPWQQWHHDRFDIPPDAELLAVNDNANQLFRIGRSVGSQFHPEVNETHICEWLQTCSPDYLVEHGLDADELVAAAAANEERNTKQCFAFVDWWLDDVVTSPHPAPAK